MDGPVVRVGAERGPGRIHLPAHMPVLDGIRGIAIASVMLRHFIEGDSDRLRAAGATGIPSKMLIAGCAAGDLGVDLFFVLSGFLITGIVLDNRAAPDFLSRFYVRRALRIFPLYYLALLLAFFVFPAFGAGRTPPVRDQLWVYLYGTNLANTFFLKYFGYVQHFWTLAIEEHFYLFWPAVILFTTRRQLHLASAGLVAVAFASRLILARNGYPIHFFTFCRMDSLILGGWLALAIRSDRLATFVRRIPTFGGVATTVLAILVPYVAFKLTNLRLAADSMRYLGASVLFTVFVAAAVVAAPTSPLARLLSAKALVRLGIYSYGLYVYHQLLRTFMDPAFDTRKFAAVLPFPMALAARVVVCSTISAVVAIASYHLIEQPLLRFKSRFGYRQVLQASQPA